MTCLTCRYYQLPESVCTLYCDWVTVHFPEQHKCKRWERRENVYSQQKNGDISVSEEAE